jgi:hypothetical protein
MIEQQEYVTHHLIVVQVVGLLQGCQLVQLQEVDVVNVDEGVLQPACNIVKL